MSGNWLSESQVLEKFEPCLGKGADADALQFANASLALISVFDLISGMGMASGDMRGNAETVKKLAEAKPGSTLGALINGECDGKEVKALKAIAGDGKTASCALLWLARALNFILKMLDELMKDKTKKMSDCVLAGYEVSLKPHHGFIIKKTFGAAVMAAPTRETFIAKLGPSEEEVFSKLGGKSDALKTLVTAMSDFLKSKDAALFAP